MTNFGTRISRISAALAFGLAAAVAASPAPAKQRWMHGGYEANARAVSDETRMTSSRASALHDCNEQAAPLREYTWGLEQTDVYRACMAGRGQPE
jgi:hypothetical protein